MASTSSSSSSSAADGKKRKRSSLIVNESEVESSSPSEWGPMFSDTSTAKDATAFDCRLKQLAVAANVKNRKLGCNIIEVDPGKTAFPYHSHLGSEEAVYILSGTGTMRLGGDAADNFHEVGPGDYCHMPPGPAFAHQLVNTGKTVLRYLCISANMTPDVCFYPDSGKMGVYSHAHKVVKVVDADATLLYYHGENLPKSAPTAAVAAAAADATSGGAGGGAGASEDGEPVTKRAREAES